MTALSDQITEVDGHLVARGQSASVRVGTVVRLAGGVMTLIFQGEDVERASPGLNQRTQMLGALKMDGPDDQ